MKILVVGTSNTLVKGGWYDGFQEALDGRHEVKRIALGGAPFSQFLSLINDMASEAPDHIVVECAANDESYPTHVGNEIFFDRLYYMFLSSLSSFAGVSVLRIPPNATVATGSPVARRQAEICQQIGCSFYDAAEEILELGNQAESPYRDKHHPQTRIAHRIGQTFGGWLQKNLTVSRPSPTFRNYSDCVIEVLIDRSDYPISRIETSLVTEDFIILKPGTIINLSRTEFIIGFFVNSGETRGILRLDGSVQKRDLFCYFMESSNQNVKRYIPVSNGLHARRVSSLFAHQAADIALHCDLFHFPQQVALGKLVTIRMDNQLA